MLIRRQAKSGQIPIAMIRPHLITAVPIITGGLGTDPITVNNMRLVLAPLLFFLFIPHVIAADISDAEIKKGIISESIASYPGNCTCPYNTMRNGRKCGGRSAYSKPGGYSPICYDRDITPQMIARHKKRVDS